MVSLLAEGAMHMLGEATVESGVVRADIAFERMIKTYEFAIEMQKQKREDLRDLLDLRVSRMDMYQLVCALLLGFCMMLFAENPMLDSELKTHWVLLPFLVSNVSAIGCLFISLALSLHTSTASHADGVRKLLEYMRVSPPNRHQLEEMARSSGLVAQIRATAPTEEVPQIRGVRIRGTNLPEPPNAWDVDNHVMQFFKDQERESLFDAYTRLTMIIGINQFLQALSYYLLGVIAKQSPSGGLISAAGTQALGLLLLRLDVKDNELGAGGAGGGSAGAGVHTLDFMWVFIAHFLPPLMSGIVLVSQFHGAAHAWTMVATASFALHMFWICYILKEIAPQKEIQHGRPRAPDRFQAVCQILHPDSFNPDGPAPRVLPWLVTKRFLVIIASMWTVGILMNLADALFQFEVPSQISSQVGNVSQIKPNVIMI